MNLRKWTNILVRLILRKIRFPFCTLHETFFVEFLPDGAERLLLYFHRRFGELFVPHAAVENFCLRLWGKQGKKNQLSVFHFIRAVLHIIANRKSIIDVD